MHSPSKTRRPKIKEIDIVRAIAIIAVVLIHATSDATVTPTRGSLSQQFFYLLNQGVLNQFAIYSFLFVSGLVLFYAYFDRWSGSGALTFYRRRLFSAVVPLLLWSLFYYLFDQWMADQTPHLKWAEFFPLLKWGDAKYHLYFMVIVLQFYVLFPLLIGLAKTAKWAPKLLVALGLLVQGGYFLIGYRYDGSFERVFQGLWFLDLKEKACNATSYLGLLLIGGYVGIAYASFAKWVRRFWGWMMAVAVIAITGYVWMLEHNVYVGYEFAYPWFYLLRFVFATSFSIALLGLGIEVLRRPRVSAPFLSLGRYSFGVYLCHPIFLNLFERYTRVPGTIMAYDLYVLTGFVFTLASAWLVSALYGKSLRWLRGAMRRKRVSAYS